jgi:hypothetical protein
MQNFLKLWKFRFRDILIVNYKCRELLNSQFNAPKYTWQWKCFLKTWQLLKSYPTLIPFIPAELDYLLISLKPCLSHSHADFFSPWEKPLSLLNTRRGHSKNEWREVSEVQFCSYPQTSNIVYLSLMDLKLNHSCLTFDLQTTLYKRLIL